MHNSEFFITKKRTLRFSRHPLKTRAAVDFMMILIFWRALGPQFFIKKEVWVFKASFYLAPYFAGALDTKFPTKKGKGCSPLLLGERL